MEKQKREKRSKRSVPFFSIGRKIGLMVAILVIVTFYQTEMTASRLQMNRALNKEIDDSI